MRPATVPNTPLQLLQLTCLLLLVTMAYRATAKPMDREYIDPLQLSTFKGYEYDYSLGSNGVYRFHYSLPTSSRSEQRTESGDVTGSYSFVAPEGKEFDFKYEADKRGFRVESNALPESPKDTDEVRLAKEQFFEAYKRALELVGSSESEYYNNSEEEEESDEESDEDSEEESEEESDEESSEESDEDEDSDEESSEESSEEDDDDEESSEESDEDSDEDDEDEEEKKREGVNKSGIRVRKPGYNRYPSSYKNTYASKNPFSSKKLSATSKTTTSPSKKRGKSTFKRPVFVSSLPTKQTTVRQSLGSYGSKVHKRKSYYYAN